MAARKVNEQEYAGKRNEILDAATRLIYVKGYERMTIQDILGALDISSGAFYHYFESKPAVLEGFIERIRVETEKPLLPIIHDPHLTAVEKLRGFFGIFDRLRTERKADITKLGRVWYTDVNAIVRLKVAEAIVRQRAPLLNEIVRQGIEEGVFTVSRPDQAGEVLMSLIQAMGDTHAQLFLSLAGDVDVERCVEEIVAVHAAYMEAIERVLGAPTGCLQRTDAEAVQVWVSVVREGGQAQQPAAPSDDSALF